MSKHELFAALDRQGVEWPDGFDRDARIHGVVAMKSLLEAALGVPLELDASAQDATFICNLGCLQNDNETRRQDYSICLTFSNFGNLCLLWGEQDWIARHDAAVNAGEEILSGRGYVPLHPRDVGEAYDGCHAEWVGKTWLDRFFAHY